MRIKVMIHHFTTLNLQNMAAIPAMRIVQVISTTSFIFIKRKIRDDSHCKYHKVYTKQNLQVTISKYKK